MKEFNIESSSEKGKAFSDKCECGMWRMDCNCDDDKKIKELEERIIKAEKAMANAYAWPNDGDPRTEHVKTCLREYRNKYPEVYKPSVSISTIS